MYGQKNIKSRRYNFISWTDHSSYVPTGHQELS